MTLLTSRPHHSLYFNIKVPARTSNPLYLLYTLVHPIWWDATLIFFFGIRQAPQLSFSLTDTLRPMSFLQPLYPFASLQLRFRPGPLLCFALALVVGLAVLPPASQAQQFEIANFCTVFQQSPQTEDARSALNEEWDDGDESWTPNGRIIQSFNGDLLDQLTFQELVEGSWRDTARAVPDYDESDRLTLCTLQAKENDSYENALRIDPEYDSNGRLDVQIVQAWNSDSEEWVNSFRSTFEYDANDNDTLQVDELWNPQTQMWMNSQRFHREYDSQNRIELERQETWDLLSQTWQNEARTQYTYSSDSQVETDQSWDGSDWVNEERRTTMLNSSGLPTQTLTETWDGSAWTNEGRSTNTFTTHNNTQKFEQVLVEEWDASASAWMNESRARFSYTDIIPVELARFEAQRIGEGAVQLTWQTASETNNSGFVVQRQTGTGTSTVWTRVHFAEGAGTTSEPQFYRFTDRAVPFEAETVHYRLKQVDLDGTTHLSSEVKLDLGTPERLALHTPFPNPSRNETTVRYELPTDTEVQIAVYDLLGRRVATPVDRRVDAGHTQFQLRTQDLPSGTYILHLRTGQQTRTQRLTVVK